MGYMYILLCSDGSFYTGSTIDLEKRLLEHMNGAGANHTKKRCLLNLFIMSNTSELQMHIIVRNKFRNGLEPKR